MGKLDTTGADDEDDDVRMSRRVSSRSHIVSLESDVAHKHNWVLPDLAEEGLEEDEEDPQLVDDPSPKRAEHVKEDELELQRDLDAVREMEERMREQREKEEEKELQRLLKITEEVLLLVPTVAFLASGHGTMMVMFCDSARVSCVTCMEGDLLPLCHNRRIVAN